MARKNGPRRQGGLTKMQIAYLIVSVLMVLSMVLAVLPMTQ